MLLEAGKHSDLIGWDDNDDAEDFDVQVLNRTFDPDTISLRIYGSDYTFFAAFDDIELFLKLFKLGAKGQCFTGDTKISLLNGTEVAIKDLVGKEEFWVYSYDIKADSIVPGRAHSAKLTKKNSKIVKVTLDNGEDIRCTPDHRFLMRDGVYKEAQHLKPLDSLMPLYRYITKEGDDHTRSGLMVGYEVCHAGGYVELTHRLVDDIVSVGYCEDCGSTLPNKSHRVRHHRDFNKLNNDPSNIRIMTFAEHGRLHAYYGTLGVKAMQSKLKELSHDPDWVTKHNKQRAKNLSHAHHNARVDPARIQDNKDRMEKNWADPVFAQNAKNAASKTLTKLFKDPVYMARHKERSRDRLNTPGYADKIGMGWKSLNSSQSFREKRLLGLRKSVHKRIHIGKYQWTSSCTYCQEDACIQDLKFGNSTNHKVESVNFSNSAEDVYDFTVDNHHNFALSSGVFVHNSVAFLKERSTKNKLVVVTFKSIDTQDVKKLLLGLSDIVDSTHYTERQNSATLYFDNAVQDAQVDLVIQNIEDQGYTVVNTTKKYRKLDVSLVRPRLAVDMS